MEGVLAQAAELHRQHAFTEVVVIGVRPSGGVDIVTFAPDRYRIVGVVRWALDRLAGKGT